MSGVIAVFPTVVFQLKGDSILVRVASEVGTGLREVLRGSLGQTVVPTGDCIKKQTDTSVSLTWKDANLKITHAALDTNMHRYDFVWVSNKPSKLVDTFEMTGAHWYGGAQVRRMVWPVEKMRFKTAPFVAGDSYKEGEWGGVQERYWLSSKGIGIFVRPDAPLFVGLNESDDNKLRLVAKYDGPYRNISGSPLQLRYSIYHGPDIMTTHRTVSKEMISRPIGIPDTTIFRLPLWSTWAICKEDIDQEKVLMLANQIKSYGINTSQLQIDDHWAVHRGDWEFNREKFPNPREMIRRLTEFGFRITIWVHPFANMKSSNIKKTELFVKGMARGAVKWWNGIGRILDITKPTTVEWYKKELSLLQENYALTSFKFDGGEATWLPKKWSLHKECNNPNMYTKKYAEFAYEMDKKWKSVEVRVGVRTQKLPIFVRMMDKDSVWSEKNGLKTIIPHALLYGIIGYPFFIPDMVGGNAYDMDRPTKSLFIRWVQVCTFMPSIQFSLPPWWFDNQTVRITKKMLALRAKHTDLLIKLAKEATETGNPIIRPLWWVAPDDDFALKCDDQFMVGNDLLVAPVLTKGAKTRPLYLPAGRWRDEKSLHVLEGSKWYFEYMVTIEDLPHFTRQKEKTPTELVDLVEDNTAPLVPAPAPQSPTNDPQQHEVPKVETSAEEQHAKVVAAMAVPLIPAVHEAVTTEPDVASTLTRASPEVATLEPVSLPPYPETASVETETTTTAPELGSSVAAVTEPAEPELPEPPLIAFTHLAAAATDPTDAGDGQPTDVPSYVPSPVVDVADAIKKFSGSVDDLLAPDHYDSSDDEESPPPPTSHTGPDAPDEGEHTPETPEAPSVAGGLGLLLRKKLEADVEDLGTDGDLASMLRGKYRFSNLDDDIEDDFLAELAEIASSTGSVETPDDRFTGDDDVSSDDNEFEAKETEDIEKEMLYMQHQMSTDFREDATSAEEDESSRLRAPLAAQETLTEDTSGEDTTISGDDQITVERQIDSRSIEPLEITTALEALKADSVSDVAETTQTAVASPDQSSIAGSDPSVDHTDGYQESHFPANEPPTVAAALLGELAGNLNRIVPQPPKRENKIMGVLAGTISADLDAAIPPPPPPTRSTSLGKPSTPTTVPTGLYENVELLRVPKKEETVAQADEASSPQAADEPPPPVPTRGVLRPKRQSKQEQPRKSTLWDELTAKVHAMPKFDPEYEFPGRTDRSIGVQASFDETDRTKGGVNQATQSGAEDLK